MTYVPSFSDAVEFKAEVERHKKEGWINFEPDKKLFVVWYIRSGYSTHKMLEVGINQDEVESYLTDPFVQAAIADIGEQYAEITTFTRSGLRARLARALDMAMGEVERPFFDSKSKNQVFRKSVDLNAVTRLIEMAERYTDGEGDDKVSDATPWSTEFPNG